MRKNEKEEQCFQNTNIVFSGAKKDEAQSSVLKNQPLIKTNMSAKTVWGTLIGNLRKLNLMTLHTACGEIRDVKFDGNTLIAVVNEDYLHNILTKGQNFEKISFYLKQIDDKINIQFIKNAKPTDFAQENLQKLKSIFGANLEVR